VPIKPNVRDLLAGGLMLIVAVVGLWLNFGHTLGTPQRMGPGYMPMLTFLLLGGLGCIITILGLFNGPDPLERWSGLEVLCVPAAILATFIAYAIAAATGLFAGYYYPLGIAALAGCLVLSLAPGWRPLGLVHAGMALFGLLLEQFGLMISIAACVAVASLADSQHRFKGVVAMILFLCALCWLVFIKQLDIRVAVWPVFLTH
jgi:hypothetical protein